MTGAAAEDEIWDKCDNCVIWHTIITLMKAWRLLALLFYIISIYLYPLTFKRKRTLASEKEILTHEISCNGFFPNNTACYIVDTKASTISWSGPNGPFCQSSNKLYVPTQTQIEPKCRDSCENKSTLYFILKEVPVCQVISNSYVSFT